jgi:hypothetical protein
VRGVMRLFWIIECDSESHIRYELQMLRDHWVLSKCIGYLEINDLFRNYSQISIFSIGLEVSRVMTYAPAPFQSLTKSDCHHHKDVMVKSDRDYSESCFADLENQVENFRTVLLPNNCVQRCD